MRQLKFRVRLQMALEARSGIFSGIDDKFSAPASGGHMFAGGTVTRFATSSARQFFLIEMDPRMNAAGKFSRDRRVTIDASLISDKGCSGNIQRNHRRATGRRTGTEKKNSRRKCDEEKKGEGVTRVPAPDFGNPSLNWSSLKHFLAGNPLREELIFSEAALFHGKGRAESFP